jgi:hypothetical protein
MNILKYYLKKALKMKKEKKHPATVDFRGGNV